MSIRLWNNAVDVGFPHVEVDSNGVRFAEDLDYIKKLKDLLKSVMTTGDYEDLARFMSHVIMIGSMHFMDAYNYDIDRVQRRIAFCALNPIFWIPRDMSNFSNRGSIT